MGNILKEKEIMPDLIISSPAVRAFSTAKFYAKALGYLLDNILIENSVYEGGAKGIIELLEKIDENSNTVLVFGHNPDMTHLAALFSGIRIDNIPTSGIVCIDFDCKNWAKITNKKGKSVSWNTPRNI